ncbi:sensor histidine kinase [uncultured Sphingomonas sp.]|uniref:sensor histidine kinase n=1 Tax=uncultured Sphingomonas sp. TaxID=158754 RepID=UPI0025DE0533|nr:sensor histidine kinase [uncultured Sphingomonas sp.]
MPARTLVLPEKWFNRLIVTAIGGGFALVMAAALFATWATERTQEHTRWIAHTYEVQQAISDFYSEALRLDAARRGFLLHDDPRIARAFVEADKAVEPALERLRTLVGDNVAQQRNLERLRVVALHHKQVLDASFRQAARGDRLNAIDTFRNGGSVNLVLEVRGEVMRMVAEEHRLLLLRDAEQHRSIRRFYASVTACGLLLLLVAAVSIWVILRYTRDLTASRNALHTLNQDLEGAVRERTVDLQRANEEIQRFAYIVSHDLRSPLVNVMGFTAELEAATKRLSKLVDTVEEEHPELIDQDARLAAREDLPEAIGFIRTSTQKMDRLINAILRLSREGRRPITPERLDMDVAIAAIADSMRHRTDELGIEMRIMPGMPSIVSDRVAVEQILSNIVENAVKYLQRGRPGRIEVSGRREGNRVVFSVADNGRGIDPRDHERIFDLFRRSGQQDQPGEGIGLAHTRALAYRLGGTITVDSTLGEGATFRVSLPTVYAGEQGALT